MNLTPGQVARIGELIDQWSFLWDKRRSVWIAAEDCPDGEQVEDADLDVLLARLPGGRPGRSCRLTLIPPEGPEWRAKFRT